MGILRCVTQRTCKNPNLSSEEVSELQTDIKNNRRQEININRDGNIEVRHSEDFNEMKNRKESRNRMYYGNEMVKRNGWFEDAEGREDQELVKKPEG